MEKSKNPEQGQKISLEQFIKSAFAEYQRNGCNVTPDFEQNFIANLEKTGLLEKPKTNSRYANYGTNRVQTNSVHATYQKNRADTVQEM